MGLQAAFSYSMTRQQQIEELQEQTHKTLQTIRQNTIGLISAYAVNEYEQLIHNEMELHNHFAIVIRDYNMGKITGSDAYVSGKIRDESGAIIDFEPDNAHHARLFEDCFHIESDDVLDNENVHLGSISVCASGRSLEAALNDIIVHTLINAGVIAVLMILTLFAFIRHFVLRPLSEIVNVITESDEDGIPVGNIPLHGSREIFALSGSMNNMIAAIKRSRIILKRQKGALHTRRITTP